MSGDFLSQSLGGLRIANPDNDDPNASPPPTTHNHPSAATRSEALSSRSSGETVTQNQPAISAFPSIEPEAGLGFDPSSYEVQDTAVHTAPLTQAFSESSQYSAGSRRIDPRSSNEMYNFQNTSSSSALSGQVSHGYRNDVRPANGSATNLSRTGSRAIRDVQYGQHSNGSQDALGRRLSRRARAPTSSSNGTERSTAGRSAEEWREKGAAVGTKTETDATGKTVMRTVRKGVKDFNFGATLGEGSYSTVLAATDRQTLKEYAIKVLDKRHIIKEKKVKYVNIERDTLNRLTEHPGIVRLYYTFQDERSLYFVLDLASGGELLGVLKKLGSFDVECTRFYAAQILDSIAYMHSRGVIHRDLKPENVLLDRQMHVKITDFGTAKILKQSPKHAAQDSSTSDAMDGLHDTEADRAVSFVGTAEYVSPELLRDKSACKASDLWAFGCIVFQLIAGRPPFKAANEYLTFQKILALDYTFPDGFPDQARDLVQKLLVLEPDQRLPIDSIKSHPFFQGGIWGPSLWRQKAPRLKAYSPPPAGVIKLNNPADANLASSAAQSALAGIKPQPSTRPQLRNVTALPPPSQLDIDWSPVLVHNNERILKLGNLILATSQQPISPPSNKSGETASVNSEKPKFSRFFSGNTMKKKERLILITSYARLIVATAGGNDKKAKMEMNFAGSEAVWKDFVDAKGLTGWTIDTKEKHFSFEDPRATTSDPAGSKFCTQEWLESLEQAKEIYLSNAAQSGNASYSGDSFMNGLGTPPLTSPSDSIAGNPMSPSGQPFGQHRLRQTLRKESDDPVATLDKGRKRFSKRHSKSGLAAVF